MPIMNDRGMTCLARRLRERAARCRQIAWLRSDGISKELEMLARDYDEDAARLEEPARDRGTDAGGRLDDNRYLRPIYRVRMPETKSHHYES